MRNAIYKILFVSTLLISSIIFANDNESNQLNFSGMLKDLRGDTKENQDYVPEIIKELREKIDSYPMGIEKSWLKSFYCRDHPELVEEGVCFCGTEDSLYIEKLVLENSLIEQFSNCFSIPSGVMIEDWMQLKISAEYNKDGTIKPNTVTLLDTNIKKTHPFYQHFIDITSLSMCNKIIAPEDRYYEWEKIIINFDFSIKK